MQGVGWGFLNFLKGAGKCDRSHPGLTIESETLVVYALTSLTGDQETGQSLD